MKRYRTLLMGLWLMLFSAAGYTQTCHDRITPTTPDSRFEVSGGEVTDLQTGLIWQRCSVGQRWDDSSCTGAATTHTWPQALTLASGEWRLPNIKELTSIVETACVDPAINLSVFPNTVSSVYWSSSPYADYGGYAWGAYFADGDGGMYAKYIHVSVRLVRGGQ